MICKICNKESYNIISAIKNGEVISGCKMCMYTHRKSQYTDSKLCIDPKEDLWMTPGKLWDIEHTKLDEYAKPYIDRQDGRHMGYKFTNKRSS